jgi:hypothetical protein
LRLCGTSPGGRSHLPGARGNGHRNSDGASVAARRKIESDTGRKDGSSLACIAHDEKSHRRVTRARDFATRSNAAVALTGDQLAVKLTIDVEFSRDGGR